MRMSNHNKIRPVDKNNLNGKYKILFSTPQTKNSNIPMEFRGLQIYNSKFLAEEALRTVSYTHLRAHETS